MKISPHRTTPLTLVSSQEKPRGPLTQSGAAGQPGQTELSPELGMVQQARESLKAMPEVDMDKVARLRQAIANDELPLDLEALSRAIVELHRR
ncbi:lateral flagella anti-sigma-28 factor, LfgM [Oceanimonas sp. GK1]|uniref:flagellar biosynthesis anti-sigma factor FlgM n=1 Tax=Oceanimonas sp. (strain GK1 / IBRC-M 10197) TaxID=511062 RepID=UPI0002495692|nr:flagellar biosynthesis anti-sigma factor FlgM [Oceanimonas sp. GK1]AEY02561.1 lateral flagella anti-sigma-28 factor, LfgM [Oceanimonas sp. GK1]